MNANAVADGIELFMWHMVLGWIVMLTVGWILWRALNAIEATGQRARQRREARQARERRPRPVSEPVFNPEQEAEFRSFMGMRI